ncbi:MAG: prolipoprotein diacylglyceryl transferase [Lachnospira sp.]|nr:prolipoprotein diacylglyceryl transferase [Lachnospira sp.]
MKPDLFSIGKFTVHGYGLMIGIGFVIALLVGEYRAKKMKMREDSVVDLAIIAIVSGFLGAKLLYIIVSFKEFMANPMAVIGSSGFVVYGGIISGVIFCMIYTKVKKLSFLEYFDLVMPEVALAQGFGRIGCFLAGCCYGRETTSAFGVVFPKESLAPSGVKLIPTQLISSAGDFLNAAILIIIAAKFSYSAVKAKNNDDKAQKSLLAGDIGCIYMLIYGVGRFLIEFLRNDERGAVGVLSTSQFISLGIVVFGVVLMIVNRKKAQAESK